MPEQPPTQGPNLATRQSDMVAAVLETVGALVVVLDRDGRIVGFNRACEHLTGYAFDEVRGRVFFDMFLLPDEVEGVRTVFNQLSSGQFPNQHENFWVTRDGRHRRLVWSNTALPDDNGTVDLIIATGIDVTELRQSQRQIEQAKREWERTFDTVPDLVAVIGDSFEILRVNRAMAERLGCTPAEAVGRKCHEVLHGLGGPPGACAYRQLIETGRESRIEIHDERLGCDLLLTASPLRDAEGRLYGSVHVARDITRLKQAQNELRDARDRLETRVQERTGELAAAVDRLNGEMRERLNVERQLRDAELRYRTVADFTKDWEYWVGPDGAMRYVSPACSDVTGYGPDAFASDPSLLHRIVLDEDAPIWQQHHLDAFALQRCGPVQFRIRCRDGAVRWVEHVCRPVTADDGSFLGLRGSNRDITDRKLDEAKLAQQQDELAHMGRVHVMGELAASLAHELNQPLAASLADTETARLLLTGPNPDLEAVLVILADIAASQRRAGEIVRRVRAQVKPGPARMQSLDMNTVVRESARLLQNRAVLDGIHIGLALQPGLPRVKGNRVQIVQVLTNLMLNAMEAMQNLPADRRELRITSLMRSDGLPAVEVADTGPGIPAERLAAIFEPFHTTKVRGLGMGLAIGRSIAAAHRGQLQARNNPDRGATFTLALPASVGRGRRGGR